jgi:CRP-like cAMP-binding protein
MTLNEESSFLGKVPLFQELEPSRLKLLAFTSEMINFQNGEILFKAGEPGDCAYVIMEGEVEILSAVDDDSVVAVLQINQIFGELALLNDEPRSATLRAKGDLKVMKISESQFMELIRENPGLALNILRQLGQKLADSHQQVEQLREQLASAAP